MRGATWLCLAAALPYGITQRPGSTGTTGTTGVTAGTGAMPAQENPYAEFFGHGNQPDVRWSVSMEFKDYDPAREKRVPGEPSRNCANKTASVMYFKSPDWCMASGKTFAKMECVEDGAGEYTQKATMFDTPECPSTAMPRSSEMPQRCAIGDEKDIELDVCYSRFLAMGRHPPASSFWATGLFSDPECKRLNLLTLKQIGACIQTGPTTSEKVAPSGEVMEYASNGNCEGAVSSTSGGVFPCFPLDGKGAPGTMYTQSLSKGDNGTMPWPQPPSGGPGFDPQAPPGFDGFMPNGEWVAVVGHTAPRADATCKREDVRNAVVLRPHTPGCDMWPGMGTAPTGNQKSRCSKDSAGIVSLVRGEANNASCTGRLGNTRPHGGCGETVDGLPESRMCWGQFAEKFMDPTTGTSAFPVRLGLYSNSDCTRDAFVGAWLHSTDTCFRTSPSTSEMWKGTDNPAADGARYTWDNPRCEGNATLKGEASVGDCWEEVVRGGAPVQWAKWLHGGAQPAGPPPAPPTPPVDPQAPPGFDGFPIGDEWVVVVGHTAPGAADTCETRDARRATVLRPGAAGCTTMTGSNSSYSSWHGVCKGGAGQSPEVVLSAFPDGKCMGAPERKVVPSGTCGQSNDNATEQHVCWGQFRSGAMWGDKAVSLFPVRVALYNDESCKRESYVGTNMFPANKCFQTSPKTSAMMRPIPNMQGVGEKLEWNNSRCEGDGVHMGNATVGESWVEDERNGMPTLWGKLMTVDGARGMPPSPPDRTNSSGNASANPCEGQGEAGCMRRKMYCRFDWPMGQLVGECVPNKCFGKSPADCMTDAHCAMSLEAGRPVCVVSEERLRCAFPQAVCDKQMGCKWDDTARQCIEGPVAAGCGDRKPGQCAADGTCVNDRQAGCVPAVCNHMDEQQCKGVQRCSWASGACERAPCWEPACDKCGDYIPALGGRCKVVVAGTLQSGICKLVSGKISCEKADDFDDDCKEMPCDLGMKCFDPDKMVNGVRECSCPPGERVEAGTCQPSTDECTEEEVKKCKMQWKGCTKQGGKVSCVDAVCRDVACAAPPPGCNYRKSDIKRKDGCPAYPCELDCGNACTDQEKGACALKQLREGKLLECFKENGMAKCKELGCLEPDCPMPDEGCESVRDDREDPLAKGCKQDPCGVTVCKRECTQEDELECGRGSWCFMVDGKPHCKAIECPKRACRAPPGCKFVKGDTTLDDNGCPESPCGELECPKECTADEEKACCKRAGDCKWCMREGTEAKCVPKPCKEDQRACLPAPGCYFEKREAAPSTDGSTCEDPCGEEVCEPVDPCAIKECAEKERCATFGRMAKCVPMPVRCADCSGKCVMTRSGESTCVEVDPCERMRCFDGTACAVVNGKPQCLSERTAPCGGCRDGKVCVPQLAEATGTTDYTCVREVDPEQDVCTVSECACKMNVCGTDSQCMILGDRIRCATENEIDEAIDAHRGNHGKEDPCAPIKCKAGQECRNTGGYGKCVARVESLCASKRCGTGQCDEETGECIQPACDACESHQACKRVEGVDVCVDKNLCGRGWSWLKGSCIDDTDCPQGMFCPSRTSTALEAFVSEHCECDPLTGDVARCSPTRHRYLRRCLPLKWKCDAVDPTNDAQREWCCDMQSVGCARYRCSVADEGDRVSSWPAARKEACCALTNGVVGCEAENEYNCLTREKWSYDKRNYCCGQLGIHCPLQKHNCESGNMSTWTDAKADYCCTHHPSAGCEDPTDTDTDTVFNCSTPQDGWGREKRDYCCTEDGLGCKTSKPDFDCRGNATAVSGWSQAKREYCCELTNHKGCSAPEDNEGPYPCDEGSFNNTDTEERRRKWCCNKRDIGCSAKAQCLGLLQTQSLKDIPDEKRARCCSKENVMCKFACPSSRELFSTMTAEARDFCCRHKGKGCNATAIEEAVKRDEEEVSTQPRQGLMLKLAGSGLLERAFENTREFVRDVVRTLLMFLLTKLAPGVNITLLMQNFGPLDRSTSDPIPGEEVQTPSWMAEDADDQGNVGSAGYLRGKGIPSTADTAARAASLLADTSGTGDQLYSNMLMTGVAANEVQQAVEQLKGLNSLGGNTDAYDGNGLSFQTVGTGVQESGQLLEGTTTPAPPGAGGDDDDDSWIYILIGCLAGACVLGVAVGGFVYARKSQDREPAGRLTFAELEAEERSAEMGTSHSKYSGQNV